MTNLQKEFNEQQIELQRAQEVAVTLTATDALRVTIIPPRAAAQPQGRAIYVPGRSSLIFLANNMPVLPARRAYELWLIPRNLFLTAGFFSHFGFHVDLFWLLISPKLN